MTIAASICARCQQLFQPKRLSQRTCSAACKQAMFRTEKCNASITDKPDTEIAAGEPLPAGSDGFIRMYPGLKPLSEIECRVMRVRSTGHRDQRGALLYQPTTNETARQRLSPLRANVQTKGNPDERQN